MIAVYKIGDKFYYEKDGEILAVEKSKHLAIACGEARAEAKEEE